MAKVWAGADVGHGDEPHAGILEILAQGVAEHLPDGSVDAPHALGHPRAPRSSDEARARRTLTVSGKRSMRYRSTRSAAFCNSPAEPLVRATDSVERCQVSCP